MMLALALKRGPQCVETICNFDSSDAIKIVAVLCITVIVVKMVDAFK